MEENVADKSPSRADAGSGEDQRRAFEAAGQRASSSLLGDFWHFIMTNKKFWLLPIVLFLLFMGALIVLGGTSVAPFIYTMF